jgi:hypothetical protein
VALILQTCCPLNYYGPWSGISYYNLTPPARGIPLTTGHLGTWWAALWVSALRTLASTQLIRIQICMIWLNTGLHNDIFTSTFRIQYFDAQGKKKISVFVMELQNLYRNLYIACIKLVYTYNKLHICAL